MSNDDLRRLAEAASGSRYSDYAWNKFKEAVTPPVVLALLDELDAAKARPRWAVGKFVKLFSGAEDVTPGYAMSVDPTQMLALREHLTDMEARAQLAEARADTAEQRIAALPDKLRAVFKERTGDCTCEPPWKDRGLEDPRCEYHGAWPWVDELAADIEAGRL